VHNRVGEWKNQLKGSWVKLRYKEFRSLR
jgi:hypothetical protein